MKLVKAKSKDFDVFFEYYDNLEKNVLYPYYPSQEVQEEESTYWDGCDFEALVQYAIQDYEREITCPGSYIFLIQEGREIVGYVRIFHIQNRRFKLADWAMNHNTPENRKKVWDLIISLKTPKIQTFDVCVLKSDPSYKWMQELGFESTDSTGYMRFVKIAKSSA